MEEFHSLARSGNLPAFTFIEPSMTLEVPPYDSTAITVLLIFGVNGTGKTTTAGKIAFLLKNQGRRGDLWRRGKRHLR